MQKKSKSSKKKLMPLPTLLKKAQTTFNQFVRNRDRHLGCISCNNGVEHAGHYFSQGHYSALRFDELNVNGQCVKCNMFLSGNLIWYRKGLVDRYGSSVVEELERRANDVRTYKWSRNELDTIIKKYKV